MSHVWKVVGANKETPEVKIERHQWSCSSCKSEGETITTQTTDSDSFVEFVFRDHDLITPGCSSTSLQVWPQGHRQNYWPINRPIGVVPNN